MKNGPLNGIQYTWKLIAGEIIWKIHYGGFHRNIIEIYMGKNTINEGISGRIPLYLAKLVNTTR